MKCPSHTRAGRCGFATSLTKAMASTTAAAAGNRDGTLLVTVGSTLFQALSDAALSPSTLALLPSHGITHLIVQLGKAQMPAHIAGQVSSSTGGTLVLGAQNGGAQTVLGGGEVLKVTVLRYTRDAREMDALLDSARVVVSHAGECISFQCLCCL